MHNDTQSPSDDGELLTSSDVAGVLGCSTSTVTRMAQSGRLEPVRKLPGIRGPYLFRRSDVDAIRGHQFTSKESKR